MSISCEHTVTGLCKDCANLKPLLVFKMCKDKCFNCKGCGYFWGPEHKYPDTVPYWISK